MSETLPEFALPTFSESSHGWGPSESSLPQHLVGLPFLPFDKSEKLTRISDWNNPRDRDNQGGNRRTVDEEEIGGDDEGGAFSLVDNKVKAKPRFGAFRPYQQRRPQQQQQNAGQFKGNRQQQSGNQNQNAQRNQQSGNASKPSQGGQSWNALAAGGSGWTQAGKNIRAGAISNINPGRANAANARGGQQNFRQNQRRWGFEAKEKEPSVPVRDDFKLVSDIELSELSGVTFEPTDSEELLMAGELKPFKAEFNRITPRTATTLARFEQRQFFTASTTEDPILNKMISEKQGNVFATDAILSLLMSASRSVYSWDLLLHKRNGQLIFDKRPDSKIDFLSVNENAADSLNEEEEDSINHPSSLAVEATLINHNFSQQCLNAAGEPIEYDEPNPFLSSLAQGSEPAQVAYRYQQFSMGPNVNLVARASVNAYTQKTGADPSLVLTRVLNEFDPRLSGSTVEWRQKLESQTGAILAVEMKNNSFKLARFLSEAVVAGVDEVKLGFVSRFNTKSNTKHQILMAKHYTPTNLAESVNIRIKTLWGSLKVLIDKLQNLPDGEYLVLRDANKPTIHVYELPADAFQGQSNAGDM